VSGELQLVEHEPCVDLSVGAYVVYAGHGVGCVSSRSSDSGDGAEGTTVVVEFRSGLSVTLPLERAEACLRPPVGPSGLGAVSDALRLREASIEPSWRTRTRTTRTKIALGDAVGLAEVVRDSVARQRGLTPGSTLSSVEQELYRKARLLLAAELSVAAGIDDAESEAWIESQLDHDLDPTLRA
jgi:RNA polymerase-interacting CarD/CdnL/TRCF family regulator